MFDIAICDDSELDRGLLIEEIGKCEKYRETVRFHQYSGGKELLAAMEIARFSLIFLDIQMQGMDGERTAEEIRRIDDSVVLVFYTGCAEPTPHSFEVQPYRFVKKNMPPQEKSRHILAALDRMAELDLGPVFEAKFNGGRLFLKPDDIVYIEKYRRGIRIHVSPAAKRKYHIGGLEDKEPEIRTGGKLSAYYDVLKPYGFGYPHDSYVISFKYLMSCYKDEIRLHGFPNMVFKIARSKMNEFNQMKKEFLTSKYGDQ